MQSYRFSIIVNQVPPKWFIFITIVVIGGGKERARGRREMF